MSTEPKCAASQVTVLDRTEAEGEEPGLAELFAGYLPGRVPPGAVADDILATFSALLADLDREEPGMFSEEARLRTVLGEETFQESLHGGPLIPALADSKNTAGQAYGERA